MDTARARRFTLFTSVVFYLIACATPALILHDRHYRNPTMWVWGGYRNINGANLLVTGLAFGWTRMNFTAFANLPLWFSWVCVLKGNRKAARKASLIALIISLETLQLLMQGYPYDEGAATQGFLAAPHIGVICWLASMLAIWFGSRAVETAEQSTPAYDDRPVSPRQREPGARH